MNKPLMEASLEWTEGKFLFRSGFYAGRPPSLGDLNSKILEMIYLGIKKDVGESEATNFVRFVNSLEDLSASSFIVAMERFWALDCKEPLVHQESRDRARLDDNLYGRQLESQALGLLATVLGGRNLDEDKIRSRSMDIKRDFIRNHMTEIPVNERSRKLTPADRHYM